MTRWWNRQYLYANDVRQNSDEKAFDACRNGIGELGAQEWLVVGWHFQHKPRAVRSVCCAGSDVAAKRISVVCDADDLGAPEGRKNKQRKASLSTILKGKTLQRKAIAHSTDSRLLHCPRLAGRGCPGVGRRAALEFRACEPARCAADEAPRGRAAASARVRAVWGAARLARQRDPGHRAQGRRSSAGIGSRTGAGPIDSHPVPRGLGQALCAALTPCRAYRQGKVTHPIRVWNESVVGGDGQGRADGRDALPAGHFVGPPRLAGALGQVQVLTATTPSIVLVDPAYRNVTIEAPAMRLILSLPAALKRLFNRGQAVEPVIWRKADEAAQTQWPQGRARR